MVSRPRLIHYVFAVILSILILALPRAGRAGLLNDIWNGAKDIASAPVRATGWLIGQGVNEAVDPALDNSFRRLRETADHAIDRVDAVSAARIDQVDQMAEARIAQLNQVAEDRINQIDAVMGKRIVEVDQLLDGKLDRIESIAAGLLDREAEILDRNVTRVDDILNRSLDRLQEIETDAFDRVDAALQDQVPFAASRVAHTVEWTAMIIIVMAVLVGYVGVVLVRDQVVPRARGVMPIRPGAVGQATATGLRDRLRRSFELAWQTTVPVALPLFVVVFLIQGSYELYYRKVNGDRVERHDRAALLLEQAGDFKAAATFRRRAYALDGTPRRQYDLQRDLWLEDFWQQHLGRDPVELARRLSHLTSQPVYKNFAANDGELMAAWIYIQTAYLAGSPEPGFGATAAYVNQFLDPPAPATSPERPPVLGKLVYIASIRESLDAPGTEIKERLNAASKIVDSMLVKDSYADYAPGLVLKVELDALLHELRERSLDAPPPGPPADQQAAGVGAVPIALRPTADAAFAADPDLVRFVRFRSASLPVELVTLLRLWHGTPPDQRAALPAGSDGRPVRDAIKSGLNEFAQGLSSHIEPLLGVAPLVEAKVERQVALRIRADLGEATLLEQIEAARASKRGNADDLARFSSYRTVYKTASDIGKMHVADVWLQECQRLIKEHPDSISDELEKEVEADFNNVRKSKLSEAMFSVF